jgi:Ulp1 family protease
VYGIFQVLKQPNSSDCGIYLLHYVEAFFLTPITNYTLPITSLRSWFPEEQVSYRLISIQVKEVPSLRFFCGYTVLAAKNRYRV